MADERTRLGTWIDADVKRRFEALAYSHGMTVSALLKRAVHATLVQGETLPPMRGTPHGRPTGEDRITVRLYPGDRALLRSAAKDHAMGEATYVAWLLRAKFHELTPLPERERQDFLAAIETLRQLGLGYRRLGPLAPQQSPGSAPGSPATRAELAAVLSALEKLLQKFRSFTTAHIKDWEIGHAEKNRHGRA